MINLQSQPHDSGRTTLTWPAWLAFRWFVPVLTLLGMLMAMPAVNSGLNLDDFLHWSTFIEGSRHPHHPGSPWGLFHFMVGDVTQNQALKAGGELMWWSADNVRLTFWRPLTEWTHWLDHHFWPQSPQLMHLHNVLWYGGLIYLLARLYHRLDATSPIRARLGALFFVFSVLHLTAVAWVAARNQLVAACFTVVCIGAFHAWRTEGSRRHGAIAVASFLLALMSAEAGLATLGYLVAHVLVYGGPPGAIQTWRRRLLDLLPFLVIVVVWRLLYNAMGYGSAASGFYIDPVADPVRFIGAMALRMPTLLAAQVFCLPSPTLNWLMPPYQGLYACGAGVLTLLAALVARAYGLWHAPMARFLALGAMLALVPMCASDPSDRLLLNAEIGMSLLLAMLLTRMLTQHKLHRGWQAVCAKVLIGLAMVAHLVVSPLQALALASMRQHLVAPSAVRDPLSLPDARHDPQARMVLLNPPVGWTAIYYKTVRRYYGVQNPQSIQALANGFYGLKLTVIDPRTLELNDPSGKGFFDNFSRDVVTNPFRVGDVLPAGPVRATVVAVSPQGTPLTVRFQFDSPMNASPWRFYTWTEMGYAPFDMPRPGQSVSLPAPDLGRVLKRSLKGDYQIPARQQQPI
jgi:hypothetical protein